MKKKNLISPQWLRNIKIKKKPFWKIFKDKQPQIINDGGWHFSFLKTPRDIKNKITSYSHQEFNLEKFTNEKNIEKRISERRDLFDRNINYKVVNIDESYPEFVIKNQEYLNDWIIQSRLNS